MTVKKCVVIGAGLAGLSAAYELTLRNCEVTVLEATRRMGGRVLTHRFSAAKELNCELGGEWIGKDHHEMHRLCGDFGLLPLQEHGYSNSFWNQRKRAHLIAPGKWCMSKKALRIWRKFEKDFPRYTAHELRELDKLDWWTKLAELGFGREDLLRRDLMDSTDFGETIRMNSAYTAATEYVSTKSQKVNVTDEMDFKVPGGNKRLVDGLARAIGKSHIHLGTEVKRVLQRGRHVVVHAKGHRPIRADFCVCAIPAHRLGQIDWGSDFPEEKLAAARELQYARITKTAVLCSRRFWRQPKGSGFSICTSLASDFCFDSTYGQEGTKGILCSYAVGDKADDIASSSPEKLKHWIVEDVAHAFHIPWSARTNKRIALKIKQQPWQRDPFTGGAYAFYRPGQWFTLRPVLAKPFKRVFFAGEHIADWQGFMEGAVVTGKAAADAVLRS